MRLFSKLYDENDVDIVLTSGELSYNENKKEYTYKKKKYSKVDILELFVKELKYQEKKFDYYSTFFSGSDAEKYICEEKLKELEKNASVTESNIDFIMKDGKVDGVEKKYLVKII